MPSHPVRLIVVLGLGQVVAFASSYYLLGVLADPVASALDLPVAWLFVALTGAFLISAVLSPLTGRWIDRCGGSEVLSLSSLAFAAALILLGLAPHPAIALLAILALGPGMGLGLYGAAFAVLAGIHGKAARGPITAVSLIGAAGEGPVWRGRGRICCSVCRPTASGCRAGSGPPAHRRGRRSPGTRP